ncbi:hypothetical protein OGAPHI_002820 [Ogataea philodendri]|uniref:Uncharacterized protein n=1 Tax=Ogataea philodendri TaxID=1378263 RepID=A0A9P8T5W0_9ASCO|nr:uncharacterized protein OGAPHI_002820 [Ogataea philodendri]KAH3667171.1 hypothetical protein OGAPHI_002820 [Ogataea philodendri]
MLAGSILYSLLAVSAVASPIHQHHQHAKRDAAVTVVVTEFLDQNGNLISSTQTASASSASDSGSVSFSATTLSTSTTGSGFSNSYSASSASSSSPAYSSSGSSSASAPSSSASSGSVEYYAEQGKGITYSPYTDSGSCKSADEVSSDIAKLTSYDIIRVYAPDCSCVTNILNSKGSGQKIFAGIYNYDSLSDDIDTLAEQVTGSSEGWDAIYAVSIGNEWVQSGEHSASDVASAVSTGRKLLSSKGWSGKVVTVDTVGAYQGSSDLCDASDFIAANAHPYWAGSVKPEDSGTWLENQISILKDACGSDKSVLITETGWPTKGDTYGQYAVPSTENQLTAVKAIVESVADQVIMFTTYDDYWKDAGSYGVEQYWGIYAN